ncbi:hypothetical protein M0813_02454 [Anaeramoeba flamelloides]|uniref:Uncharacterized protein n=1 Tax=Anaeramoeba flamelloides TaxID=1746091 RepID=A0ABQ8YDG2_9EUKA|nr:hypothetical protein M0813_02454 [Anaeramoeba flamelloides]
MFETYPLFITKLSSSSESEEIFPTKVLFPPTHSNEIFDKSNYQKKNGTKNENRQINLEEKQKKKEKVKPITISERVKYYMKRNTLSVKQLAIESNIPGIMSTRTGYVCKKVIKKFEDYLDNSKVNQRYDQLLRRWLLFRRDADWMENTKTGSKLHGLDVGREEFTFEMYTSNEIRSKIKKIIDESKKTEWKLSQTKIASMVGIDELKLPNLKYSIQKYLAGKTSKKDAEFDHKFFDWIKFKGKLETPLSILNNPNTIKETIGNENNQMANNSKLHKANLASTNKKQESTGQLYSTGKETINHINSKKGYEQREKKKKRKKKKRKRKKKKRLNNHTKQSNFQQNQEIYHPNFPIQNHNNPLHQYYNYFPNINQQNYNYPNLFANYNYFYNINNQNFDNKNNNNNNNNNNSYPFFYPQNNFQNKSRLNKNDFEILNNNQGYSKVRKKKKNSNTPKKRRRRKRRNPKLRNNTQYQQDLPTQNNLQTYTISNNNINSSSSIFSPQENHAILNNNIKQVHFNNIPNNGYVDMQRKRGYNSIEKIVENQNSKNRRFSNNQQKNIELNSYDY